jgi:membrane fusion protein, multidrug efflux system
MCLRQLFVCKRRLASRRYAKAEFVVASFFLQLPLTRTLGCSLVIATMLAGCGQSTPSGQRSGPPPTVIVDKVVNQDLASTETFTGRIEAIDTVEIRARISGFLKARNFVEGAGVKKGSLLFEIEREPFEIALAQANANLANAKAALTLAQQTFERNQELAKRKVTSQANLDTARAQLEQAQAAIKARDADVAKARLDLSYTQITAPMDGRIGRAAYSPGAYLTAQSNPLATLVRQDPIYVTFPVPQRLLLEVRKQGLAADSVYVELILSDGKTYDQKGRIQFVDVQATSSTDSVLVRASIPNPKRFLVDRQIVQVRVVRKKPERKLVVSQSALLLDQQGTYVLAVGPDNKVAIKRIQTGAQRGPLIVVEKGLEAGDRVIVSGHQKARPGAVVSPHTAQSVTATGGRSEASKQ